MENKMADIVMISYRTMVWPHLEYHVQFWPWYHFFKSTAELGKGQKRTIELSKDLEHLSNEGWPEILGLLSMEKR